MSEPTPLNPLADPAVQRQVDRCRGLVEEAYEKWRLMRGLDERRLEAREVLRRLAGERKRFEQARRTASTVQAQEDCDYQFRAIDSETERLQSEVKKFEARIDELKSQWEQLRPLADACRKFLVDEVGLREQDLPQDPPIGRRPYEPTTTIASIGR